MAYGVEIAGGYRAGSGFAGEARQDTAYVTGLQREATRQGEFFQTRLDNFAKTYLGDTISQMSSDIAYLTGGYKLDEAVQMQKLDVAANVQKRLADEASAAGAVVGFDIGPNPDQAIEEVGQRSAESGGMFDPSFDKQEGSVEGLTAPDPSETGPTQPAVSGQDVTSDYQPEEGGQYDPSAPMPAAPGKGQDASANVAAARSRGARRRPDRPPVPRRATHTNVGTTEVFVSPTTGGLYARTAKGLTVPISEQMFGNLIDLQKTNAEVHLFNQTAAYEDSLSRWADALTEEQLAANAIMGGAMADSFGANGTIPPELADAMRKFAESGGTPEKILQLINAYRDSKLDEARNAYYGGGRRGTGSPEAEALKLLRKEAQGVKSAAAGQAEDEASRHRTTIAGAKEDIEDAKKEIRQLKEQINEANQVIQKLSLMGDEETMNAVSKEQLKQARAVLATNPRLIDAKRKEIYTLNGTIHSANFGLPKTEADAAVNREMASFVSPVMDPRFDSLSESGRESMLDWALYDAGFSGNTKAERRQAFIKHLSESDMAKFRESWNEAGERYFGSRWAEQEASTYSWLGRSNTAFNDLIDQQRKAEQQQAESAAKAAEANAKAAAKAAATQAPPSVPANVAPNDVVPMSGPPLTQPAPAPSNVEFIVNELGPNAMGILDSLPTLESSGKKMNLPDVVSVLEAQGISLKELNQSNPEIVHAIYSYLLDKGVTE